MVFLFYMEADLVYKRQYYKLIKKHDKFTDVLRCIDSYVLDVRCCIAMLTRHIKKHTYWCKVNASWRRMNASRRKMSM